MGRRRNKGMRGYDVGGRRRKGGRRREEKERVGERVGDGEDE